MTGIFSKRWNAFSSTSSQCQMVMSSLSIALLSESGKVVTFSIEM